MPAKKSPVKRVTKKVKGAKKRVGHREEDIIHGGIVNWLRMLKNKPLFTGSLGGIPLPRSQKRMVKLLGYKAGQNDLDVIEPSRGYSRFAAEIKTKNKRSKPSRKQVKYLRRLKRRGVYVCMPRSIEEFKKEYIAYINGKIPVRPLREDEIDIICEQLADYIVYSDSPASEKQNLLCKVDGHIQRLRG
jgi:hypothetical protein